MGCYTAVHAYCTSQTHISLPSGSFAAHRRAHLLGEDLYKRVVSFAREFCDEIRATAQTVPRDQLLDFYNDRWNAFVYSSKCCHHLFRYLNRLFEKREMDEGKKIGFFMVFDLFLTEWRVNLLGLMEKRLSALLLDLIQQQRNGEYVQQLPQKDFMRSVSESLTPSYLFSACEYPLTSKPVTLGYYWDNRPEIYDVTRNSTRALTGTITGSSLARRWEDMFHASTRKYYTKVSNETLATGSAEDYINMVSLTSETLVRTR